MNAIGDSKIAGFVYHIGMAEEQRDIGQIVLHGLAGAFLAGLAAMAVQFFWHDINWLVVGIAAVIGLGLAAWQGDTAIDFLKEVLRLS